MEHQIAQADIFPQRVFLAEQHLCHARTEHDYFTLIPNIHRINETTVPRVNIDKVDAGMIRKDSLRLPREIFLAIGQCVAMRDRSGTIFDFWESLLQIIQVVLLKGDASVGRKSVPRFRGIACPNFDHIRREVAEVIHDAVAKSVACPQQDNQHEDSPGNGETGEESPEFVLFDRTPDFAEIIKVEHTLSPFQ